MARTRLESYLAIPRDVLFWLPERKIGKSRRSFFSDSVFLSSWSPHLQIHFALVQLLASVCILSSPFWHVLAPSHSIAKI